MKTFEILDKDDNLIEIINLGLCDFIYICDKEGTLSVDKNKATYVKFNSNNSYYYIDVGTNEEALQLLKKVNKVLNKNKFWSWWK